MYYIESNATSVPRACWETKIKFGQQKVCTLEHSLATGINMYGSAGVVYQYKNIYQFMLNMLISIMQGTISILEHITK